MSSMPLIAHIVFRFDYGGLENGVANLINGLSGDGGFRHAVIALTEATAFKARLPDGVPVYGLGKRPGKDPGAYLRLFRLLRRIRPAAVHTRNVGTLDCAIVAFLARVPVRIHGEHGWDVDDPDGTRRKYRILRRVCSRFVHAFVTVSEDLRAWLTTAVGIPARKVTRICNGVDVDRFRPLASGEPNPLRDEHFGGDALVIGSVTRFSAIKDPLNLVDAFIRLRTDRQFSNSGLSLLMVGDGELKSDVADRLERAGAAGAAWLPGSRDDIPELLRAMDVFVLGSLREGISNTVLEAMASGLPVVATDTGGNSELIVDGETGALVPTGDCGRLADAIGAYAADPESRHRHGRQARGRAESHFSIATMVEGYRRLYTSMLALAER